jgi:hypothetical protein
MMQCCWPSCQPGCRLQHGACWHHCLQHSRQPLLLLPALLLLLLLLLLQELCWDCWEVQKEPAQVRCSPAAGWCCCWQLCVLQPAGLLLLLPLLQAWRLAAAALGRVTVHLQAPAQLLLVLPGACCMCCCQQLRPLAHPHLTRP